MCIRDRYSFDPGEAVFVVAGIVSARGSDQTWRPSNELACTIFGGSVGSGDFGRVVGDSLQAFGATRIDGKLDS